VAVLATAAFLQVERRAVEPVLPLSVFRNANFSLVTVIGFFLGFVMFGSMTFLPLFQQTVQGASATNSGMMLLPMLLSMMIVSLVVGRATTRSGNYKIFPIVGGALVAVGLFLLGQMDTGTSPVTSGLFMAVLGAGMGFLMQLTMLIAQNSVEAKDMGIASSTAALFRTIGGSFGVSIMGALFTGQVRDAVAERGGAAGAGAPQGSAQLDAASLAELPSAVREVYRYAVASGTQTVFLVAAAISLVGFAAAWFVKEVPLRGAPTAPAPGADAGGKPEAAEKQVSTGSTGPKA
jgi:MFS family permease